MNTFLYVFPSKRCSVVKELKNWIYPLSPEEEGEGGGGVKTKVVNNLKHFLVCFLHDLYDKLQINIFPNSTTKLQLISYKRYLKCTLVQ